MVTSTSAVQQPTVIDGATSLEHILAEATSALDAAQVDYVVFGGVASSALGRPRTTRDVDILLRPESARMALRLLDDHGFETDQLDDKWIFKAQKGSVVVDLIFATRYGIHLDSAMLAHAQKASFAGVSFTCIGREDLLIIKAVACDEASPRHWFDALGLIIGGPMDWGYLLERSNRASRRVLSLLLYAQSIDYFVPRAITHRLIELCDEPSDVPSLPVE